MDGTPGRARLIVAISDKRKVSVKHFFAVSPMILLKSDSVCGSGPKNVRFLCGNADGCLLAL